MVAGFPIQTLLDVGLLADDAGFQDGEIGGGGGGEFLGQVFGKIAAEAGLKPANPGGVGMKTEVWNRRTWDRSGVSCSTFTSMPAVKPFSAPPLIVTLTSPHCPLARVATALAPSLLNEKSTLVIVGCAVVGQVENESVQAIFICAKVQHTQARLLRRAERLGRVGPAGGICWAPPQQKAAARRTRPGDRTASQTRPQTPHHRSG